MIARRLCLPIFVILAPLALPVLRADVTLRYKTEIQVNTAFGKMAQVVEQMNAIVPRESVLRFKDGKGFATSVNCDSITDFTTKEITLLDNAGKRYSKMKSDAFAEELAHLGPAPPAQARAAAASFKSNVTPPRLTGRTATIQGVETEEREFTFTMEGPAMPNVPPGIFMKMVVQIWTVKPSEVLRVPAIREVTGYSLYTYANMNPAASFDQMVKQFPDLGSAFGSLLKNMHQETVMRMHLDMFMPSLGAMLREGPDASRAGFDPETPLLQMNQEIAELSTAPVPASVFQIPEGYQEASPSDLVRDVFLTGRTKPPVSH